MKKLLLLLFIASNSYADAIPGQDYLGGAKYENEIITTHPSGYAAGFFLDTFGDAVPIISKLAGSGKTGLIRIHLEWRDNHKINSSEIPGIAKKATRIQVLAATYPNVVFQVSGVCEHTMNSIDAKRMRDGIKAACPLCEFVNAPWTGAILPGEINELHGDHPKKPGGVYQVSTDGNNLNDMDADAWQKTYSDAKVRFGWAPRMNLRQQGTTAPPKLRIAKPSSEYLKQVVRLNQPKGSAPTFSFPVKPFPKNWIYKTDAEDQQGATDDRHNKPLFISANRGSITIKASNGTELGTLAYYGNYAHSLFRAYSGFANGAHLFGVQIGDKAKEATRYHSVEGEVGPFYQGSEYVALCYKKDCFGPVNPSFRQPPR